MILIPLGLGLVLMFVAAIANLRAPLQGIHSIRQADTLFTAWSYCTEQADFLKPRVAHRGAGNGVVIGEFPLASFVYSLPCKVTGSWSEPAIKVVLMIFLILNAWLWGHVARSRWPERWPGWEWFLLLWLFSTHQILHAPLALPDNVALTLLACAGLLHGPKTRWIGAGLFVVAFGIRPYFIPLLPLLLRGRGERIAAFIGSVLFYFVWYRWWAPSHSEFHYYETGLASPRETWSLIVPILTSTAEFLIRNLPNIVGLFLLFAVGKFTKQREWLWLALGSLLLVFFLRAPHLVHHHYYLGALAVYLLLAMAYGARLLQDRGTPAKWMLALAFGYVLIGALNTQHEWHAQARIKAHAVQSVVEMAGVAPEDRVAVFSGEGPLPTNILYWIKRTGWLFRAHEYIDVTSCPDEATWAAIERPDGWEVIKCQP